MNLGSPLFTLPEGDHSTIGANMQHGQEPEDILFAFVVFLLLQKQQPPPVFLWYSLTGFSWHVPDLLLVGCPVRGLG